MLSELSQRRFTLLRDAKFIGLDNYIKLFNDPEFWNALKVTLYYVLLNILSLIHI